LSEEFERAVTHYCFDCGKMVHRSHKTVLQYRHHQTVTMGRLFPKAEHLERIRRLPPIRQFLREVPIPDAYDLRNVNGVNYTVPMTVDEDQGPEGSCTGWGARHMMGVLERLNNTWIEDYSARDIYNNARYREGNLSGEGAYMIDIIDALIQDGVCRNHYWPYQPNFDNRWPCPNADGPIDALDWKIAFGADIAKDPNPIQAVQLCIMQLGAPDFGTPWTQSWMDNWLTGNLPLPTASDPVVGGHSWDPIAWKKKNSNLYFTLQNSWGISNAMGGYADFPAETLDMAVNAAWANAGGWEGYKCGYVQPHLCPTGQYWDPTKNLCVPDTPVPPPDPVQELIQCLIHADFDIYTIIGCIETFLREEHILQPQQRARWQRILEERIRAALV
jgi:hypothetical protein